MLLAREALEVEYVDPGRSVAAEDPMDGGEGVDSTYDAGTRPVRLPARTRVQPEPSEESLVV
jgi:hypothetical protein